MNVLGSITASNLTLTDGLNVGLLKINSQENSIDILGTPCYNPDTLAGDETLCEAQTLYLQKNLAGNVNILDGALIIEANGNVKVNGTLSTNKLNINTDSVAAASAGKVTILAGDTNVQVDTTALGDNSLIFVTPERPVVIGSKKIDNTKFEIELKDPESADLDVSWWIIN